MSDVLALAAYFGLILFALLLVGGGIMLGSLLENRRATGPKPASQTERQRREQRAGHGRLLHH